MYIPYHTVAVPYLAAEHRRGCLRESRGALETAVAHELLHGGDVDVPLLRAGVHPGRVDVHAHDVLGDAAVAFLVPEKAKPTQASTCQKATNTIDRSTQGGTKKTSLATMVIGAN